MSINSEDDEVVESFSVSLENLTEESKAHIDLLTQVAEENLSQAGAIVKVVNDQLRKTLHSAKLPILYLIDSIIKNVGEDYIGLFPSILKQCFANIYEKVDEKTRQSMCQLRQSWSNILSPKSLHHIDMQILAIDPGWTVKVESSQSSQNSSPKILINRNFFSSVLNCGNTEKDEAEVLREQLLFQKKIRELEREQNTANKLLQSELDGIKESSDKQYQKKTVTNVTVSLSSNEKSAKSQADSTTSDGSSTDEIKNRNEENVLAAVTVPAYKNNSFCDERTSGQLKNLLSVLIAEQNHKFTEQPSEKLPLQKNYCKRDKHRKDYRQTRYYEDKLYTNYNSSQRRSYNRHHWYASSVDGNEKATYECSRKAKDHPMELSNTGRNDEPKPQFTQDCQKSSEISQAPAPVHKENFIHLLSEAKDDSGNVTISSHPKRKLNLERADNEPQIKTTCVKSSATTLSSQPPFSVTVISSGRETLNFESNMTNCNARFKETCYHSCAAVANTSLTLGSSNQHFDSAKWRNRDQITTNSFNCDTKTALLIPKPNGQGIEKSIEIRREIDYNHGYGLPEKKKFDSCVEQENILYTAQLSKKPVLQSGSHTFLPLKKNLPIALETSNDFLRNCDSKNIRLARSSHKDNVNDLTVFLPPANQFVLEQISKDIMKSIPVDEVSREIRFYGGTAIIGSGSEEPREVFFKPGEAEIILNNIIVPCAFHKPDKEVVVNSKLFRVRLGAPTRELIVNDEGFQCAFNCSPVELRLSSGEILHVQLKSSTTPIVEIGAVRLDLVVGQVFLGIDSAHFVRIFLDAKPQSFYVGGVPHILKFADGLRTILVNDRPVNLQFGGPSIALTVNGVKHFVSISELPAGIIPGQMHIVSMPCVMSESYAGKQKRGLLETPHLPAADCKRNRKRLFQRNHLKGRTNERKRRSRSSVNSARKLQRMVRWSDNPMSVREPSDAHQKSTWNYCAAEPSTSEHLGDSTNLKNDSTSTYKSKINVHELFQNLCNVGLLKPQGIPERIQSPVYEVDFRDNKCLKWKQPKIISTLYSGIQCSSCGVRFFSCNAGSYREHLDVHFQQNQRLKKPVSLQSRSWYCDRETWIQLGDPEVFALNGEVEMTVEKVKQVECSVPSHNYPPGSVCEICREKFEEFFHDDEEEWHLKDCMSSGEVLYHPACFKDQNTISSLSMASKPCEIDTHCEGNESQQLDGITVSISRDDVDECQPVVEVLVDNTLQATQSEFIQHTEHSTTDGSLVCCEEENNLNEQRAKELLKIKLIKKLKKLENETENIIREKGLCTESDPLSPCNTNNCFKEHDVENNIKDVELKCISEKLETVILKPKLTGRKLVVLPPAMKGSETSNLCCVS